MSMGRRAYDLLRGYVNREWDRIQGIEWQDAATELDRPSVPSAQTNSPESAVDVNDPQALARRLLGVAEGADFEEIRRVFERLNRRSDPANFPPDSEEARQAAVIQKRINWAYRQLTDGVGTTEKRFKSLEIEGS